MTPDTWFMSEWESPNWDQIKLGWWFPWHSFTCSPILLKKGLNVWTKLSVCWKWRKKKLWTMGSDQKSERAAWIWNKGKVGFLFCCKVTKLGVLETGVFSAAAAGFFLLFFFTYRWILFLLYSTKQRLRIKLWEIKPSATFVAHEWQNTHTHTASLPPETLWNLSYSSSLQTWWTDK